MAEKERTEQLHRQWCSLLPFMHIGFLKYVSFRDYVDSIMGRNLDLRDTDVIVREIKERHGLE